MAQGTLPVDEIVNDYWYAFKTVYGKEPKAHYLGNGWYYVNGETVYRTILEHEIVHLHDLARKQRQRQAARSQNKGVVKRLIDKLRNL